MAKFRNDGDKDRHVLGYGFACGCVVEVPDDMEPSKLDFLRRNFTEVTGRQVAIVREDPAATGTDPAPLVVLDERVQVEVEAGGMIEDPEAFAQAIADEMPKAPCGAQPPATHDDPPAWIERHSARCYQCRDLG